MLLRLCWLCLMQLLLEPLLPLLLQRRLQLLHLQRQRSALLESQKW
jgi:hypothetical protein